MTKFFHEKAKHPKKCLILGCSMQEAQIKQCPLTPSPIERGGTGEVLQYYGWKESGLVVNVA